MTPEQEEKKTSTPHSTKSSKIFGVFCFFFLLYLIWAADSGNLPATAGFLYDFRYGDKAGHFVIYGVVAVILCQAFPKSFQVWRFQIPYVALLFLLFALGEEWSQTLFPRRMPDLHDGLCSALGICIGTWAATRKKKSHSILTSSKNTEPE